MRSRSAANAHLAEVARQRLEELSAEIAETRAGHPSRPQVGEGPGDLPVRERVPQATPLGGGRHALRTGRRRLVAGWVHDRLPPTLQGRVRLGTSQLAVVATVLAVGLAASAWWVLRTDDAGALVPVSQPAPTATSSAERSPGGLVAPAAAGTPVSAASTGTGVLVVDVAGKVRRPGIATLPAGSRVIDAIKAAGGVRRGVDLASLNQARPLVDGEQILVGESPPTGVAASAGAGAPVGAGVLVSLNTADQATLETLPGVGPVTARSILDWRDENGGFRAVDELLEVSGIGDATLARLAPLVTL